MVYRTREGGARVWGHRLGLIERERTHYVTLFDWLKIKYMMVIVSQAHTGLDKEYIKVKIIK